MSSKSSISERLYLQRGDEEPQERTSTLVLTSPSLLYVDVRLLKDTDKDSRDWQLEMAFAGLQHKQPGHASWDHWIDSSTDSPVDDSGTMELLPDGTTLESGSFVNNKGIVETYRELWGDLPVSPDVAVVLVCHHELHSIPELSKQPPSDSGNLQEAKACGMVIRVGSYCQGILKVHGNLTVERWSFAEDGWKLTYRCGNGSLPHEFAQMSFVGKSPTELANLKDEFKIEETGKTWKCVELCTGPEGV